MVMRLFFLSGLVAWVASLLVKKFLSDRKLKKVGTGEVSMEGRKAARELLDAAAAKKVELQERRRPFLPVREEEVTLLPKQAQSREISDVAECLLRAGLGALALRQPEVIGWRVWAVKFSISLPAFTVVVMAFALVVGKVGGTLGVGLVSLSVFLSCVALWATVAVEREAAALVVEVLERKRLFPRLAEEEAVVAAVRAMAWRRITPGVLW